MGFDSARLATASSAASDEIISVVDWQITSKPFGG
jgi:hypothetical protein